MFKQIILAAALVAVLPWQAQAEGVRHYVPPRAEEALAKPKLFPEEQWDAELEANRVRYSVLIGTHDYDALEREAAELMQAYSARKISGDRFNARLFSMVPVKAGAASIDDLRAWTAARPKSYAAWYVLARQYYQLARDARGGEVAAKTPEQRQEQMRQYAVKSWDAFSKSLGLYAKPLPSYVRMIALEKLGGPFMFGMPKPHSPVCKAVSKILAQDVAACSPDDQDLMDAVLQAAIRVDPDNVVMYDVYFTYGVPRWGGDFKHLETLYDAAAKSGRMRAGNLAELRAMLLWWQGAEAVFYGHDYVEAARLTEQAYEANPGPRHVNRLYDAASYLRSAGNKDAEVPIYTKIISVRPEEYRALFQRAQIAEELHGDHETLFEGLIPSAKLGYMYAQNNIGYYYMTGSLGFPVDLQQAKKWLTLAANQGLQHSRDKLPVVDAMIAREAAKKAGK